jgi:asparagine synthase (glutamine-hydrolysing)
MERVAEQGVKVLLDGQGADELLAVYPQSFNYLWGTLAKGGKWLTLLKEIHAYRNKYPRSLWYIFLGIARNFFPPDLVRWARRFRRVGVNLGHVGVNPDFAREFRHRSSASSSWRGNWFEDSLYDSLMNHSLPALLRYEDRNSMAHSIEARVPFLDYRLVEFIFGLPPQQKMENATTKVILRHAMRGTLPEKIRRRSDKMGFVTPEKAWLKAELGALLEDVAHSSSFAERGCFDVQQVQQMITEHQIDKRDISFIASRWLTLELWYRQFIDGSASAAV